MLSSLQPFNSLQPHLSLPLLSLPLSCDRWPSRRTSPQTRLQEDTAIGGKYRYRYPCYSSVGHKTTGGILLRGHRHMVHVDTHDTQHRQSTCVVVYCTIRGSPRGWNAAGKHLFDSKLLSDVTLLCPSFPWDQHYSCWSPRTRNPLDHVSICSRRRAPPAWASKRLPAMANASGQALTGRTTSLNSFLFPLLHSQLRAVRRKRVRLSAPHEVSKRTLYHEVFMRLATCQKLDP
jgi:hypothetical protein